jgi:hypothetical protein
MKRLLLLALFLLVVVSLGMAILLVPAFTPHAAAAYDGQASAAMSCTDHTATMTRTVLVTITWKKVDEGGGVAEADVQAYENSPAILLAWGSTKISPPQVTGTASFTLSFNDTTPFGNLQWQLYNFAHIAPVKAGLLDASNFPGCPYP